MDEATVRALLEQHFSSGDPELGERFEGAENLREWRSSYPASTAVEFREIRGSDDLWVVELTITYDGGPPNLGLSILEFRGHRIARETIYVAEGWEAPDWRAQWRSAP